MNDGYDLLCIDTLRKAFATLNEPADDVTCACAEYLAQQDMQEASIQLTGQRAMLSAAQLIPTTTNFKGEAT